MPRITSKPSRPSTRRSVTTGKWFTPDTVGSISVCGIFIAMARSNWKLPTSWHRPTVLIDVSRQTDRVSTVMGFVMLSNHASGTQALHVLRDADEDRDVPQGAADAAGAHRVAHGLPDAVGPRHVDVD